MTDIYVRIYSGRDDIIAMGQIFSYAPARYTKGPRADSIGFDADQCGL